jgi:glutathione S-transferase
MVLLMLTLVIGNKNLSTWSLRPWLMLKHLGLAFEEVKLTLDTPQFKTAIARYCAAGRVPVLRDGETTVWDSLAIIEYVSEKCQGRGWPADRAQRAHARAISAEMHSGFAALRECWPMKAAERIKGRPLTPAAAHDVKRIEQLWLECRERYSPQGPWLFGEYSSADAMYAPVALRFNTYGAALSAVAEAYVRQTLEHAHLREWLADAEHELTQGTDGG